MKKLLDERIDAEVRALMKPVSILDRDLERIIQELRQKLIDSVEACRRMAALRGQIRGEAEVASQHGLSPVSIAVYELLERSRAGLKTDTQENAVGEDKASYRTEFDETLKGTALKVEAVMARYRGIVDWQTNFEVQRQMRRDIKRELRASSGLSEEELDNLAREMLEIAKRRLQ